VKRNRRGSAEEESMVKNMFLAGIAALMMFAAQAWAADTTPKSVIHVITIQWKSDATPDKIDKAIKGAEALPAQYSGITHVWTKPIKKQLPEGYSHVIVMEFASEDALQKYAGSAAQKHWYELYMPIREESRTSDITN
jgi:Stress responsive A/B Barrel Domain